MTDRLDFPIATSDSGLITREDRRRAKRLGFEIEVGPKDSPISCLCTVGHPYWAPGFFQEGVGTIFDNAEDRWCLNPGCNQPDAHCASLGPRPDSIDQANHTGWFATADDD